MLTVMLAVPLLLRRPVPRLPLWTRTRLMPTLEPELQPQPQPQS
jgi:hypothetical protein